MKLLSFFLFVTCMHAFATGNAQKVTITAKQMLITDVLKLIGTQSGHEVIFTDDIFENTPLISLNLENVELSTALDECLKGKPFVYEIMESVIVIKAASTQITEGLNHQLVAPPITVRGKIVNEKGEPIVASVIIKGTKNGTTSDNNGDFVLNNVEEDAILIITATNISPTEFKINSAETFTIKVKTTANPLEEVIFKGYYSTTRRNNTGNVAKVSSQEISRQPINNPLQAIQGRMAGVSVTQLSGLNGGGFTVQIRGRNSVRNDGIADNPLYIIDGVPFPSATIGNNIFTGPIPATNPLSNINPQDIESIEILKDADATSIYGSRGSNGVVLITTKKGKTGTTKIDVNYYTGMSQLSHKMDLLNTEEYRAMRKEGYVNDQLGPEYYDNDLNGAWGDSARYTDWQEELLGKNAGVNNVQLSISGGGPNTQFLFGANYYKDETVFPGNFGVKKGGGLLNITHSSLNNKIRISASANYTAMENKLPIADLTNVALNLAPNAPTLRDSLGQVNWQNFTWTNPLPALKNSHVNNSSNFVANATISYQIIDGLSLRTSAGFNTLQLSELQKNPLSYYEPIFIDPSLGLTASARNSTSSVETWIVEPQLEYRKRWRQNNFNFLLGTTFQESISKQQALNAEGFTSDALLDNFNSAPVKTIIGFGFNQYKYNALLARVNYEYKDKFLFNLTARRDGSSRFGPGKRFANFGAVGLGWIFSDENFIKSHVPVISFGKLRGSLGTTGNDQIPDYGYLDAFGTVQYVYQGSSGFYPLRLANSVYSWETNKKIEAALELGFFDDRLMFTTSAYRTRSSSQLVGFALSGVTGFQSVQANLPATIENSGLEIELSSRNINDEFKWITQFNISFPRNKLVRYPGIEGSSYAYSKVIGESIQLVRGFQVEGVDPQSGLYSLKDVNGDNEISFPDDFVNIGVLGRKFFGGLRNIFDYKGVSLDVLLEFVKQNGYDPVFSGGFNMPGEYRAVGSAGNQPSEILQQWQTPGTSTKYQKFSATDFNVFQKLTQLLGGNSNYSFTDASFIRVKNIAISYSFSKVVIQKMKIQSLRLYCQGQNLFTITNYKGLDPETQSTYALPPLRVLNFGFQVSF